MFQACSCCSTQLSHVPGMQLLPYTAVTCFRPSATALQSYHMFQACSFCPSQLSHVSGLQLLPFTAVTCFRPAASALHSCHMFQACSCCPTQLWMHVAPLWRGTAFTSPVLTHRLFSSVQCSVYTICPFILITNFSIYSMYLLTRLLSLKFSFSSFSPAYFNFFFASRVCIEGPVSPLLRFYCIFHYSIHFNTQMVTHPSANLGPSCITSVILRELVFPT